MEYINNHLDDEIKLTDKSGIWRYLIRLGATEIKLWWEMRQFLQNLLCAVENIGIVSIYGKCDGTEL